MRIARTSPSRSSRTARPWGRSRSRAPAAMGLDGEGSTSRFRPARRSGSSSSRSPRRTGGAPSACRRGRRDERQVAGAHARIRHRSDHGADAGAGRIRPRRGLLPHCRAELRELAAAAAPGAAPGHRADRAVLVVQFRASRPHQVALRRLAPRLHHLAGRAPRRARVAPARVRFRRPAQLLALPVGAVPIPRRRRAGPAPLLVRGADVLPRPPRLLRHPHLRDVGGSRPGLAARHRAAAGWDLRPRARGQAQRMVPPTGAAGARAAAPSRAEERGAAQAALAAAFSAGALRRLAPPLARSAAASPRLDRVPHPARSLRLVVLRPGPARSALPRFLPPGARRAGPSAAHRRDARRRRRLAAGRIRAPPLGRAAPPGAGPRRRRAPPVPASHHADLWRDQALARVPGPACAGGRLAPGPRRTRTAEALGGRAGDAVAGALADRTSAPVRHQRLRRAGRRTPWRGYPGDAAAVLVEQRHRRAALAEFPLSAGSARVLPRGERRELSRLHPGGRAASGHPLCVRPGAVGLRGAAMAPGVPRPRAPDLERVRHPASGDGAVPGRSAASGGVRPPGFARRAVEWPADGTVGPDPRSEAAGAERLRPRQGRRSAGGGPARLPPAHRGVARRRAGGPVREGAHPRGPARAGHLPRRLRARPRGDAARVRADRPLLPQRRVPAAASRRAGGADRALHHPVPGRLGPGVPGVGAGKVQAARPGRADGEGRGSTAARLPAAALSLGPLAAAFRGAIVRDLGRWRGLVRLAHLVEEEQGVLAVALRLERHADLEQRVRDLVRALVLLQHLLELDDGVVPLLLRIVRLAQPVLRVGRQLVLGVAVEEVLQQIARLGRLPLNELLVGQVVERAAIRRPLLLLLLLGHELVRGVQRLLLFRRRLFQGVQPVLDDLELAAKGGDVVLRLLHVDRQVRAALAGGARELVERLLQRFRALLLLGGQLLAFGRGGLDLLLQIGAQGRDVLPHLFALLRGGHAGSAEKRDEKQSLHSGLHRDLDAAILGVRGLVVAGVGRTFLAVAGGLELRGIGAELNEILAYGIGAALAQRQVVFGGAALVGMAGDDQPAERRALQTLEGGVKRLARLRRKGGVVVAEIDRLRIAGAGPAAEGILRPTDAVGAGLSLRAIGIGAAPLLANATALRALSARAAVRVGGALRNALALRALHPLPALLVPGALGLRHADGVTAEGPVGVGGAVRVLAALPAEPVDADLPVIGAVRVRLALRVLGLRTPGGHDRHENEECLPHGAHLLAPARGVKEGELVAPPQSLQLMLAAQRRGPGPGGLRVHQGQRATATRVARAASAAVGGEALGKVVGDAGVQGSVPAAEEVDAPHGAQSLTGLIRKGKFSAGRPCYIVHPGTVDGAPPSVTFLSQTACPLPSARNPTPAAP